MSYQVVFTFSTPYERIQIKKIELGELVASFHLSGPKTVGLHSSDS
jgi:hypothetical protein